MPVLEARTSDAVAFARASWCAGDAPRFKAAAYEAKLDLWAGDTLYTWITTGPATHVGRTAMFPNVTMHYELMRSLVDASTASDYAFWDEDQMKRWIDLLVERQYPWFVCRSWNHLTPLAISCLLYTSDAADD